MKAAATDFTSALAVGLLTALACGLLLLHDPQFFWNDDYQLAFLPVFEDVNRAWWAGEWPLLTESSWVCGNLAGEYQYGTFSVFINICILAIWSLGLPLAGKAAAFSTVHLVVLATGSHTLARGRGIPPPQAAMVGFVAALNGWIICWGATNWVAALTSFAWLPWAWWSIDRLVSPQGSWRDAGLTTLFLYLTLTAGWPFTVLMLLLLSGWITARLIVEHRRWAAVARLAGVWVLGGLAALPALWMLISLVEGSVRARAAGDIQWNWVVPLTALPGFFLPSLNTEWRSFFGVIPHASVELACGLAPVSLACWGLVHEGRRGLLRLKWEWGLLGLLLLLCLLPSAGVFRWSFRWLPLLHLVLGLIAADYGYRMNPDQESSLRPAKVPRWLNAGLVGLCLLASSLLFQLSFRRSAEPMGYGWLLLGLATVWWLAVAFKPDAATKPLRQWLPAGITLGSLLCLYLFVPADNAVPSFSLDQSLANPTPLTRTRTSFSAYLADDLADIAAATKPAGQTIRPGNTAMFADLRLINGYSPIQPRGIASMLPFDTHGFLNPKAWVWLLNHALGQNDIFDQIGIDGLVVSHRAARLGLPPQDEWQLVQNTNEGLVFHRRGRAADQPTASLLTAIPAGTSELTRLPLAVSCRHEMAIEIPSVDRPSLLIFHRPWYPGWQAHLNDQPLPVVAHQQVAIAVSLPPHATGRLVLHYRPPAFVYGLPIASLALTAAIGCCVMPGRQRPTELLPCEKLPS